MCCFNASFAVAAHSAPRPSFSSSEHPGSSLAHPCGCVPALDGRMPCKGTARRCGCSWHSRARAPTVHHRCSPIHVLRERNHDAGIVCACFDKYRSAKFFFRDVLVGSLSCEWCASGDRVLALPRLYPWRLLTFNFNRACIRASLAPVL